MKRILYALTLTLSFAATAAPRAPRPPSFAITSVAGVSAATRKGTITMYGGFAGPACTAVAHGTCNSCLATNLKCLDAKGVDHAPLCACNPRRVNEDTMIKVNLRNTYKSAGHAIAVIGSGPGATVLALNTAANAGHFVDFRWASVCAALGATSCELLPNGASTHVTIGLDLNNNGLLDASEPAIQTEIRIAKPSTDFDIFGRPNFEGVGGFALFPADGGLYLENVVTSASFPGLSYGSNARYVRVFTSETSLEQANALAATHITNLQVVNNGAALSHSRIKGLKNGTRYFNRVGLVDQSGNLVQYFPDQASAPASCLTGGTGDCPFAATPEKAASKPTPPVPTPLFKAN